MQTAETIDLFDGEQQYLQLVKGLPAAIYACDARGRITFFNQAAVELWGRAPRLGVDEWCGSWKIFTPDGRPIPMDECPMAVSLREGREVHGQEIMIERPDGTRRNVLPHPRPIFDVSGKVVGAVNMLLDVTDRRSADESRARLAAIVDTSEDAIVSKTLDGIITSWNNAAERTFGYTAQEAIGRHITLIIPPNFRDEERSILERLRRGERIEHYHAVRQAKDGTLLDISLTISPLRDRSGRIIGAAKIARDITQQKRIEKLVRDNEERLRILAETVPSIVWTADPQGTITWVNHRWLEYCGITAQQNDRKWPQLVLHPDDHERCTAQWNKALAEGTEYEIEVRNRRHDGAYRWFMTRAVPLRDGGGAIDGWFGITTDIHDLKELQAALRDADRRKDEFLATLAHELRNPLVPIRNALEILRAAGDNGALASQARSMMERQVKQMVRLVDDLLDISRISQEKLVVRRQRVALSAVIESAVESSRPLIDAAAHQFTLEVPGQAIFVDGDLTRLSQVLLNLLNNSAKFTDRGGRIWLRAAVDGGNVVIRVQDNGIGITPDVLPNVFDKFTQADCSLERSGGGLGLGLSLARALVEIHGGTIKAHSEGAGKGSEFVVTLPLALPPPPAEAPADGNGQHKSTRRRVLVADDNRDIADSLALVLEMMGNEVRSAGDGREALELAERFRPDVMLLDIGMPGLNGYGTAQRIREQPWGKSIKLIALTGWGQDDDRRRSHDAGFDHHIVKPVEPEVLEQLLSS